MRLNDEQRLMVEENHNLIYWIIHDRHLDINEWYDLLAIELCLSVVGYQPSKGSFSNYYKIRSDSLISRELRKETAKKKSNNGIYSLDVQFNLQSDYDLETEVELESLFEGEYGEILRLKRNGYNQTEIADILGYSQSYVSRILKGVKTEYDK